MRYTVDALAEYTQRGSARASGTLDSWAEHLRGYDLTEPQAATLAEYLKARDHKPGRGKPRTRVPAQDK